MRHNPPGVTPHTLCALGGCARHHKLWILRYLGKPAQRVSSEGRKEGKMKCWKNHSFKRHFFFPCCRWSYRNQSLPFRPRTGKEPVNQRAKLSSGTAQQSVLLLTNKVGAENTTPSPHTISASQGSLSFTCSYLPQAHQSQQINDLQQQTVCPCSSYLFNSQGRNLALTVAQGSKFSLSLWWKSS